MKIGRRINDDRKIQRIRHEPDGYLADYGLDDLPAEFRCVECDRCGYPTARPWNGWCGAQWIGEHDRSAGGYSCTGMYTAATVLRIDGTWDATYRCTSCDHYQTATFRRRPEGGSEPA